MTQIHSFTGIEFSEHESFALDFGAFKVSVLRCRNTIEMHTGTATKFVEKVKELPYMISEGPLGPCSKDVLSNVEGITSDG